MNTQAYNNINTGYQAVGRPRFSQPFSGDNGAYVLQQDWQYNTIATAWAPLALNTAHPVYTNYYLTGEGPLSDIGGSEVRWTRTYCQVPLARDDESTVSYAFIGFVGNVSLVAGIPVGGPNGRLPFTATVPVRLHNDYFMIGTGGTYLKADDTSAGPYATAAAIPLNYSLKYYIPAGSWSGDVFTPTTLNPVIQALTGTPIKGIWDSTETLPVTPYAINLYPPSVPTRTYYEGLMAAQSEIIIEDSPVIRWKGNIYQRLTKYVIAR